MKYWIACGLVALLFFAAGCGGDAPQTSQNTAPVAAQENPPVAPSGGLAAVEAPIEKDTAPPKTEPVLPAKKTGETDDLGSQGASSGSGSKGMPKPSKASPAPSSVAPKRFVAGLDADRWTDVAMLDPTIAIDIRYATVENFTKTKIYDCPRCFLRPEAALAIAKAQEKLQKRGYSLKMFDCYRPRPYQQKLWDKVPNPDYVTPPQKGSMHSRGAAVDLTIVDKKGKELDMGTPYDFFGEKAHADCTDLPEKVLENRKLLKKTLESVGFRGIRTEWWHFSFGKKEYELSSELWQCE